MTDLVHTLLLCGLLSGTQPITLMGLLLVMGGAQPRRNATAFLCGAFIVQASLLLLSAVLIGGTVPPSSGEGRSFVALRIIIGLLVRRPPGKPIPEIPHALERLREMQPKQSFIAGIVVADYQGPVIASFALATASVSFSGRLVGLGVYSLVATGIPAVLVVWTMRSDRARDRVTVATTWVMRNRRKIASWFGIVGGVLLIIDGIVTWVST